MTFGLPEDEALTCSFELDLHLAAGSYRVCTWVYRYDTQTLYDHWAVAATLFVSNDTDVRGAVNLYPTVAFGEKREAPLRPEPTTPAGPSAVEGVAADSRRR